MTALELVNKLWNELYKTRSQEATTWPCPQCHGLGYYTDGMLEIGPQAIRRPSNICVVCKGKGRVRVTPIP
jgi:hypothetical protein